MPRVKVSLWLRCFRGALADLPPPYLKIQRFQNKRVRFGLDPVLSAHVECQSRGKKKARRVAGLFHFSGLRISGASRGWCGKEDRALRDRPIVTTQSGTRRPFYSMSSRSISLTSVKGER